MKKEEEEKRNTRFRIKGKESVFFFERKFFPDISPTDLIKNFGNEKKERKNRTRGTNGKERSEGRKESIDHQCAVRLLKRVDILWWQTMIHFDKTLIAIKSIAVDKGK